MISLMFVCILDVGMDRLLMFSKDVVVSREVFKMNTKNKKIYQVIINDSGLAILNYWQQC